MEQYADASAGVEVIGCDDSQCRCGKRQSASSSSHLGISSNSCDAELEPRAKKPMIYNPNYKSALRSDFELNGFSEVKLPIDFNAAMNLKASSSDSPFLRRCVSDPYNSPGDGNIKSSNGGLETEGILRRCISDPSQPVGYMPKNQAGVASNGCSPARGLPPLYPGTNRLSNDVVTPTKCPKECLTGQSPDSLRLKRIKERVKEMARLWVDVVSEEDETPDDLNHNASTETGTAPTTSQEMDEKEEEEQIGVEKVGDGGLKIKLRCPCGSGYELLITGYCCYYKIL